MVDYFLGLGLLMLLALIGVYIVRRYGQSVILAYIVVGILIGPNLAFSMGGIHYEGLITNEEMIHQLLEVGLIFLFFFVGLEFSITRLRETKKAAAAIAITHVSMNLFVGFGGSGLPTVTARLVSGQSDEDVFENQSGGQRSVGFHLSDTPAATVFRSRTVPRSATVCDSRQESRRFEGY